MSLLFEAFYDQIDKDRSIKYLKYINNMSNIKMCNNMFVHMLYLVTIFISLNQKTSIYHVFRLVKLL